MKQAELFRLWLMQQMQSDASVEVLSEDGEQVIGEFSIDSHSTAVPGCNRFGAMFADDSYVVVTVQIG